MATATSCLKKKAPLPAIKPSVPAGLKAVEAKTPSITIPSAPPTPWTPQTSRASSQCKRFFNARGKEQTTPAAMPMTTEVSGETYPAAGVIVASPATAPVSSPTNVGRLSCHQPTAIQVIAAKEAATSVLRKATAVVESTRNSLPALKP